MCETTKERWKKRNLSKTKKNEAIDIETHLSFLSCVSYSSLPLSYHRSRLSALLRVKLRGVFFALLSLDVIRRVERLSVSSLPFCSLTENRIPC